MTDLSPAQANSEFLLRDPLTNAYSRAVLFARLQEEIDRGRHYHTTFSLCLFDLDHFKSINDAYGHVRGDTVLRELTARVQVHCRASDLLFRYGGDEFVLLLPNTSKDSAVVMAQRLLDDIRGSVFAGDPPLTLSLSMGIVTFPQDGTTAEALFTLADERNYSAKRQGRSRVVATDFPVPYGLHVDPEARLIEREAALSILLRFLDNMCDTSCGVLRVTGPPGSGRTRMLQEIGTTARLRNIQVLTLLDLIQEINLGPASALEQPTTTAERIGAVLRQCIKDQSGAGVLLILDDLPAVEPSILALLRHLLKAPPVTPFAVAYTTIPTDGRDIGPAALRETVVVLPFSPDALQIWLRSLLQWEAPDAFRKWLHQATGGLAANIVAGLQVLIDHGMLQPAQTGTWTLDSSYQSFPLATVLNSRAAVPVHNLPSALTPFFGRGSERTQIADLLGRHRLVTLVGPGGIGKTRLALEIAGDVLHDYADGVWFVPLAAIRSPELVLSAIAQVLEIKEAPGQSLMDVVQNVLHTKQQLLLLDNFEQVIDAAVMVTELLAACPQLSILVTSRIVLRVYGEQVVSVPPLAVPAAIQTDSVAELMAYPAVAFFVSRAQALAYDFKLSPANASVVAQICARLDGLPLALELAAARIDEYSPAELLLQLDARLNVLIKGPRDQPARQQTLRDAIDWSYTLLDPVEQHVFARLGVFIGGCTLAAAEAVCKGKYRGAKNVRVADVLTALVDKSLLQQQPAPDGQQRYVMLEMIREFALECQKTRRERTLLSRRHAAYFLDLLQEAAPALKSEHQGIWLDRLEVEHPNLRAALLWNFMQGDIEAAIRFVWHLWAFWFVRSYLHEGRQWITKILSRVDDSTPLVLQADAFHVAGGLAYAQDDYVQAGSLWQSCLELRRQLGDVQGIAGMLNNLALVAIEQRQYKQAATLCEESLAVTRQLGNQWGIATTLNNMGLVAVELGVHERARERYSEALTIYRQLGDTFGIARTLMNLGEVATYEGRYDEAEMLLEESISASRALKNLVLTAWSLTKLARVLVVQGELTLAAQHLVESLEMLKHLGANDGLAKALEASVELAVARGQTRAAVVLLSAAEALRQAIHVTPSLTEQELAQEFWETFQTQLDSEALADAQAEGRRLTLDEMVAFAQAANSTTEAQL